MRAYETKTMLLTSGLAMALRRYPGGDRAPALCIPGLTRNGADFEDLAPLIAETGRDVVAVSLRGRGPSDYDPDYHNYHPLTYRDDALAALDALGWNEAIFVGTSLGGIVTMLVHQAAPARVTAAVLNDVGPELAAEGIARIKAYIGENAGAGPAASLEEAAARVRAMNEAAFPDASSGDWLVLARRTFRQCDDGSWVPDYDPNIARALAEGPALPDLWPAFESLKSKPTLVIRGAISDLLTQTIVENMRAVHPAFEYIEVPRIGHAPFMTEPEAWKALEKFLAKID